MTGCRFTIPVREGGILGTPAMTVVGLALKANGPEDQPHASAQWDRISWRVQEEQVRRLRQRIFKAAQEQDWQPPQSPEQWELWWLHVTRRAIAASYLTQHGRPGPPHDDQIRLVHAPCQRGLKARQRGKPEHQLQPDPPLRLA